MAPCAYLAPARDELQPLDHPEALPLRPRGARRLVCVSDTHCEHGQLVLPPGDVLVHAGDCLTESGSRHVSRGRPTEAGLAQFERFAAWFGAQPFENKVLVAGNHDGVLEALGPAAVRATLARAARVGSVHYLEHETAEVAGLRVFGSPFRVYASVNRAFGTPRPFAGVPRCDVVVTHVPAVLPHWGEDVEICALLARCGAQLHVGGHNHWAYGTYRTSCGVLCVVASSSSNDWVMNPRKLEGAGGGPRGDPADRLRGGYNIRSPPIVVDVAPAALEAEAAEAAAAEVAALAFTAVEAPKP